MSDLSSVTVIIPVFNGERFIRQAIESVLLQEGGGTPNVIVYDDGSTDGTSDILAEYQTITVLRGRNSGQAAAINRALSAVKTEFVAYLDSDDESEPNRLSRQLKVFESNEGVDLVYSDRKIIDAHGYVCRIDRCARFDMISIYQKNIITRSSVMHRVSLLETVGVFDPALSGNDDWDMWVRIAERYRIYHLAEPLVRYRIHGNNISVTRPRAFFHNRRCRSLMLKKAIARDPQNFRIRLMLIRAKLNELLLRTSLSEGNARFWGRVDRFQEVIEYYILVFLSIKVKCRR